MWMSSLMLVHVHVSVEVTHPIDLIELGRVSLLECWCLAVSNAPHSGFRLSLDCSLLALIAQSSRICDRDLLLVDRYFGRVDSFLQLTLVARESNWEILGLVRHYHSD